MLKVTIVSKVDIAPISQEYIEELLRKAITEQNPEVHVNSFAFTQRRDPARIEVTVDAQIGAPAAVENVPAGIPNVKTVEEGSEVLPEAEPVVETTEDAPDLDAMMDQEETKEPETVAGLFS